MPDKHDEQGKQNVQRHRALLPGVFVQWLPGREDDEGAGWLSPRGIAVPGSLTEGPPSFGLTLGSQP